MLKWLSQSPALNPIENLWRILKKESEQDEPSNFKELEIFSNEEWDNIPLKYGHNLIQTYRNRSIAVIAVERGPIKYLTFFATVQIRFSPLISWNII